MVTVKKCLISILLISGILLLTSCNSVLVDLDTPKSEELSSKYTYYSDSMNTIRGKMGITPEQADEVFIVLSSCGLDSKISSISGKDGSYTVWWGANSLDVKIDNGVVSEISSGKDILYPEYKKYNILLDCDVKISDVKSGSGDIIGQRAYISVLKSQLKEITEDNYKEFVETVVKSDKYKGFNYFTIKCDDDTGLLFSSCSDDIVTYGEIDDDDTISKSIGFICLGKDGTYTYEKASDK